MKPIAPLPAASLAARGIPPEARRLVSIYGLLMLARMLLMTVLPLKAMQVFGGPKYVSSAYFLIGCVAIVTSLYVPALAWRINRRVVFMLGAGLLMLCLPFLAANNPFGVILGLALQAVNGGANPGELAPAIRTVA